MQYVFLRFSRLRKDTAVRYDLVLTFSRLRKDTAVRYDFLMVGRLRKDTAARYDLMFLCLRTHLGPHDAVHSMGQVEK